MTVVENAPRASSVRSAYRASIQRSRTVGPPALSSCPELGERPLGIAAYEEHRLADAVAKLPHDTQRLFGHGPPGEEMLPWLRGIDGFDGLLMITNEAGATLTLTFWRDRDMAERHRATRMQFRDRITAAVNVSVEETVDYDVAFVHLGARLAALQSRRRVQG